MRWEGNKYGGARKVKPFRDALMMEIKAAGDDHKALRKIAAALLAKAASGDVPAINSLADRTDGKVAQALIGDSEEDGVRLVHTIRRRIVEPMRNRCWVHLPKRSLGVLRSKRRAEVDFKGRSRSRRVIS